MKTKSIAGILTLTVFLVLQLDARAQDAVKANPGEGADPGSTAKSEPSNGGGAGEGNLAEKATDPSAPIVQLQFQNVFIPDSINASGYANQFIVQPVIPFPKMGSLPRSILRPTIPVVTSPDIDGGSDGTTGLGDTSWVYIFAFDRDWGTYGLGGAGAIPTATDRRLGARKWTLGPSVFYINTTVPKWQLGGLVFNTWSVGGAGPNRVNKLSFQPVVIKHFNKGWFAGMGDLAWTFDWENSGDAYIPLSLRVGRVFSIGQQQVNLWASAHYNVGDEITGQDRWGIKLNLTFLLPE